MPHTARPATLLALLLLGHSVLHFALGWVLGLSGDEAHYALYGANLALSYYDHPPLVGWIQAPLVALHAPYLYGLRWLVRQLSRRQRLERGMKLWHDMIDWVGGYPFEVARPEAVFDFYRQRGFDLQALKTCGGRQGCNEFVFRRSLS